VEPAYHQYNSEVDKKKRVRVDAQKVKKFIELHKTEDVFLRQPIKNNNPENAKAQMIKSRRVFISILS